MQLTRAEAAVILGIVIPLAHLRVSSAPSGCSASLDTCMSDLCRREQAFPGRFCHDEGCQIKGSEVCNVSMENVLDLFPSLRGCVCAWEEEELCDSIQALAAQCNRKTAIQLKRSAAMDWKSSSLIGSMPNASGSCFDQMTACVSDAVCNKYLASVLQACAADPCDRGRCQQVTGQFYGSMPQDVAEMLVMCECEASDQRCLQIKASLHSGTCEDETQICQNRVRQCLGDSTCRDLLKAFQAKCWRVEDAECSVSDLQSEECFINMDPALIYGADSECKMAFVATLGTVLHHPCSCEGARNGDLRTCNMIHNVLHNRSLFTRSWISSGGPSKPPEFGDSEHGRTWSHDYPLYNFAVVLLVGVLLVMPLAVVIKIWMLRKRDKTTFHHPQKSNCVVIF